MTPRRALIGLALVTVLTAAACGSTTEDIASVDASSAEPSATVTATPTLSQDTTAEPVTEMSVMSAAPTPAASSPSPAATSSPLSSPSREVSGRARGSAGQVLIVSDVQNLSPQGTTVTVRGRGFDESIGIYVALCVIPSPGEMPTPCGGGVDMAGASGASVWVSSNAPNYGSGLAQPYQPGGDFVARISFTSQIGSIDCRMVPCAVVARADHLRIADRSADVFVPVTFAGSTS